MRKIVSSRNIFITAHKNSDPDALSSAIVLRNFIEFIGRKATVSFPEGLNEVSKKIVDRFKINCIVESSTLYKSTIHYMHDLAIVVDTSSIEQLGLFKNIVLTKNVVVIDHHIGGDLVNYSSLSIIDPKARSTSELVYLLLKDFYPFSSTEAMLLLAGIIYDTRRFFLASPQTFEVVGELVSIKGVDYRSVIDVLQTEMDISERIARIKAARRLSFKRINDYIIVSTHVSAFEGSVARALLDLGADVAIVGSSDDETRIVVRAKQRIVRELGISIGRDIMPLVGEFLGGGGGGHDTAGAASGKGDLDKALYYAYRLVVSIIEKKINETKMK